MALPYPDPTIYAVPAFLGSLVLELWAHARRRARGASFAGYEAKDTWASLAMGVGSLFSVTAINLGVFALATRLAPYRFLDLGSGPLAWTTAIVGWDFAYYWHHRIEHECRLFWASHVNHHSSRYFNFSTALRQPWTPFTSLVFFPPLALLGVAPWLIMVAGGINLIYQFWVHTELVGKLPRPLELVLNTPSHHRVHHGKNERYLDKNYGGILIVWDRLFRTFEVESEPVRYGMTHDITSFNPFVIAFHEYAAIARDVARARRFRDAFGILVHGPAWRPPAS